MPISAVDAINPALEHTKQQLLHPFRVSQWAKLAVVGFLAGELSSSGGCNGGNLSKLQHPSSTQGGTIPGLPHIDPTLLFPVIGVLVVTGIVLWLVFAYINSVMHFVLFDSIVTRQCRIRESWNRRQAAGWRFFLWQMLFAFITLAISVILLGIPAGIAYALGWFNHPKEHWAPLLLGGIILLMFFLAFTIVTLVVHVFTKDFVVPQMAIEGVDAVEGWRRLLPRIRAEAGSYAGYAGMKVLLAIAAGIIFGIITLIVILVLAIPIGALSVAVIFAAKAAGLTWTLYTITAAVVVGCILIAVILYLVSLISVPAIVFFPAYSLYFFAARYPPLQSLLYPTTPPPPSITPPVGWTRGPEIVGGTL